MVKMSQVSVFSNYYFTHWWAIYFTDILVHAALCYKPEGHGFIPDGVTEIFHWHNPSGCTMAQGSTQLLTEISTRNISWGAKVAEIGLTTLLSFCSDCLEIWEPHPPGTLRACPGLCRNCFTVFFSFFFLSQAKWCNT